MIKQLLSLLLLLLISLPALSQDWHWVKDAGGPGYSESKRVATDVNGNSYVIGNFASSVAFGMTTLTGNSNGEAFLVKYDNSGTLKWAKQIGASSVAESMDLAVDGSGNSYLTGNFKGTANIGAFTLSSLNDRAAFVAKLDATGNVVWAKQANSTEGDVKGESITVDGSGNVYVTGNFFSSATFGATTITATKDEQVFIAKYAANGNLAWVRMAGGLGSCFTHDITTDDSGNLYLTGQFWLTATFGSTTLYKNDAITSPGEIFVAKYDASGNALWAKQAGGAGSDAATGIVVDSNGNSYLAGFFQGSATFGNTSVSGSAGKNAFLAKYSAAGGVVWVRKHQASGDAAGTAIELDASGHIYTAGYFEGSVAFGNATLISYGSYDMFFAKYDANGTVTGAMQAGGAGTDVAKALDVNTNGGIYFTGDFSGSAIFGATTLSENMVVGKLNFISYNQEPAPTITPGSLSSNMLCSGASVEISFSTTGRFGADNIFTVQLSDYWGSFAYPTGIGSGTTSPVTATVPAAFALGTGYKIRVIASSPGVTGAVNGTVTISKPPAVIASAASKTVTAGSSTILYATGADTYVWSPATGLSNTNTANPVATPQTTTTYTVTGNRNGCSSTASVTVRVEPVPPLGSALKWDWVKQGGDELSDSGRGIATDGDGNVYVMGSFSKSIAFGSTTLSSQDMGSQIFLVKYSPDGGVIWAREAGGTSSDFGNAIAVDKQGNIYIVGTFSYKITFGSTTLTNPVWPYSGDFVAKYDTDGNALWARQTTGENVSATIAGVATDTDGAAYITGAFYGAVTFGSVTFNSNGSTNDVFIVKYNAAGEVVWGKQTGGTSRKGDLSTSTAVATDKYNNVYLISPFTNGTLVLGANTITASSSYRDSFIAKYEPDGMLLWVAQASESGNSDKDYKNITLGTDGHIYIGDGRHVVKYDDRGRILWSIESSGHNGIYDLSTDAEGHIYITGIFKEKAFFGPRVLVGNTNQWSLFVVKYDPEGNVVSAEQAQGTDIRAGKLVAAKEGDVYVTGEFNSFTHQASANFGCHTITSSNATDYYVAKLSTLAGTPPALSTGSINGAEFCAGSVINVPFTLTNSSASCSSFHVLLSDAKGSFNNLKIIGAGTNSPIAATIPANIPAGSGYRIKVIGTAPSVTGADNGTNIIIAALPVVSVYTNKTNPCPGTTGVTFTAFSLDNITSYIWSVPDGWVITAGQGTKMITVTAGATKGDVAVSVRGECGAPVEKKLSVAPAVVFAPTVYFKEAMLCRASNTVFTASGAPYGASYRWYASATDTEPIWEDRPYGSESKFYTPVVSSSTTFYVSLLFNSGCESERVPLTITMATKPEMPEKITRSGEDACTGTELTFEVPAVSGAYGYEWTVPYNWQIISGQYSSKIVVKAGGTGGSISVAAYNSCGYSENQTVKVSSGTPLAPSTFSGSRCGPGSVTVHAFDGPIGGVYRWYEAVSGGTAIGEGAGNTFATPALVTTTVYFVSAVSPDGCESARTAVPAVIYPAATATAGPDETHCIERGGYMLTGFSPNGGAWSGKGVTNGGYFDPASAGAGTHVLTYTVTKEGCTATATKQITVLDAPTVTLAAFGSMCSTVRDYILTGGQPAGGVYSGIGVENGLFNPVDSVGVGTYVIAYTYTNGNGCTTTAWQNLAVTTCTGLPESKLAAKLVVYPNPTQSDLNIALPLAKGTALILRLFDAKGQKVYEQQYSKLLGEFKQVVSLKNKPKGVYLLQLILDDGVVTKRVVVE